MQRLDDALRHRADRGTPIGADALIERVIVELRGDEELQVVAFPTGGREMITQTPTRREPETRRHRPRWRAGLAFGVALILVLAAIGVLVLLPERDEGVVATTVTTTTATTAAPDSSTAPTSVPATTAAPPATQQPTTTGAAALPPPTLGEGWELLYSTIPGDPQVLNPSGIHPTEAGYYVALEGGGSYLLARDGAELTAVDMPDAGFVSGGPGVVAYTTVGPEESTEGRLWVSSDGIAFERVAADLLTGCTGEEGCTGTEIYGASAAPDGRVLAFAHDPLVYDASCECWELNPVALVSADGYAWTKTSLDLLTLLPAEWRGEATVRSPIVYVAGKWLTYATRYVGETSDQAFFASGDGIDWYPIDTGNLTNEAWVFDMVSNGERVVAIGRDVAYWSDDGERWTQTALDDRYDVGHVAAFDSGFVVTASLRARNDGAVDGLFFSADGRSWTTMTLDLPEAVHWNAVVGDGPNLVAAGMTETNLRGIWRWSP